MKRFSTFHEASLYVAQKRSEGYMAEVLHDNSGFLWGESVFSFPVIVSQQVLDEEQEDADHVQNYELIPLWVTKFIFWLLVIPCLVSLIFFGIYVVSFLQNLILESPSSFVGILFGSLVLCLFVAFCFYLQQAYKDSSSLWHKPTLMLYRILLLLLILAVFLGV